MKKNKLLLGLLVSSLLCLSGCSLFNDDDIAYENKYNPATVVPEVEPEDPNAIKVLGVTAKDDEKVPNALCFKSVPYDEEGFIVNTYKTGGVNHLEYNVNGGEDYPATKRTNNFDLYVPKSTLERDKNLVILFIHGGAWVSGFKTDVNEYVHSFANKGYITATIKYTLLKRTMDDSSLSIFRDLDEIDACIKAIKTALVELDLYNANTKLAIGGASSGAHLSMLYSYSRGQSSALPINFVIDAVGPVDIKPENWKAFKNSTVGTEAGLTYDAITAQAANLQELSIAGENPAKNWNEYQTLRIANGMCGLPYSLEDVKACTDDSEEEIKTPNAASTSMTKVNGGEDQLSVTYWINKGVNKFPIICAYGGRDSIVGVAQFAKLEKALKDNLIDYQYTYFKDQNHTEITRAKNETAYDEFLGNITAKADAAIA